MIGTHHEPPLFTLPTIGVAIMAKTFDFILFTNFFHQTLDQSVTASFANNLMNKEFSIYTLQQHHHTNFSSTSRNPGKLQGETAAFS